MINSSSYLEDENEGGFENILDRLDKLYQEAKYGETVTLYLNEWGHGEEIKIYSQDLSFEKS